MYCTLVPDWMDEGVRYRGRMPKEMLFARLMSDPECPECRCVNKSSFEDTKTAFCRRIWDKELYDGDFISWWELGKRPSRGSLSEHDYCKKVCGHKGVSVRVYTTRSELLKHFEITRSFKPGGPPRPKYYCTMRFLQGAGRLHPSPSTNDRQHHDVFKADDFDSAKHVEVIEIGEIDPKSGRQ